MQLRTKRLLLRRFERADLEDLADMQADPAVTRFVRPLGRDEVEERLHQDEVDWERQGYGLLAVTDRRTGAFLGRSGLKFWPQFAETEVGWMLRRDAWGHGYATEAAEACLGWALGELGLPYVTAMIEPDNERSIRVAQRLGMERLREDVLLGIEAIVFARHPPGPQCEVDHITHI